MKTHTKGPRLIVNSETDGETDTNSGRPQRKAAVKVREIIKEMANITETDC